MGWRWESPGEHGAKCKCWRGELVKAVWTGRMDTRRATRVYLRMRRFARLAVR